MYAGISHEAAGRRSQIRAGAGRCVVVREPVWFPVLSIRGEIPGMSRGKPPSAALLTRLTKRRPFSARLHGPDASRRAPRKNRGGIPQRSSPRTRSSAAPPGSPLLAIGRAWGCARIGGTPCWDQWGCPSAGHPRRGLEQSQGRHMAGRLPPAWPPCLGPGVNAGTRVLTP